MIVPLLIYNGKATWIRPLRLEDLYEVPAEELQKVKNNFAAGEYRKLSSNMAILMQLIHNEGNGHWQEINEAAAKYQAVTAADVKRVVGRYLTSSRRTIVEVAPPAAAAAPAVAAPAAAPAHAARPKHPPPRRLAKPPGRRPPGAAR